MVTKYTTEEREALDKSWENHNNDPNWTVDLIGYTLEPADIGEPQSLVFGLYDDIARKILNPSQETGRWHQLRILPHHRLRAGAEEMEKVGYLIGHNQCQFALSPFALEVLKGDRAPLDWDTLTELAEA